jgi:hypothetical protein
MSSSVGGMSMMTSSSSIALRGTGLVKGLIIENGQGRPLTGERVQFAEIDRQ